MKLLVYFLKKCLSQIYYTVSLYFFKNKLKEDLAASKKQIDQNKLDLRNFYQGQMEVLVQNKLKEFQSQLDKSENTFKERELAIAKTAAMHIEEISQK